jgi:hypothetical protein
MQYDSWLAAESAMHLVISCIGLPTAFVRSYLLLRAAAVGRVQGLHRDTHCGWPDRATRAGEQLIRRQPEYFEGPDYLTTIPTGTVAANTGGPQRHPR